MVKILWATSELVPYAMAGGLADVSQALPKALSQRGHDIRIVLPYYSLIDATLLDHLKEGPSFFDSSNRRFTVSVGKTKDDIPLYLLHHEIFNVDSVYQDDDMAERFALFSWAVIKLIQNIDWAPEIIQGHDWPTGPLMAFVHQHKNDIQFPKTVFTIHNLAYQGSLEPQFLVNQGLRTEYYTSLIDEGNPDTLRYLRLGLLWSDKNTTVSQTYAREILTSEYGYGLEQDLNRHSQSVDGIVHGIDIDLWDPSSDPAISNYSISQLQDKVDNKIRLQAAAGIKNDPNAFVIGLVSRLVYQKGLDLIIEVLPSLQDYNIQLLILGTGETQIETQLQRLQYAFPENYKLFLEYNSTLSRQFFAGLDTFLIPSRYEPCGLTQLYAMRYGSVPIVRKTGGLADTVTESDENQTGFVFKNYSSEELLAAILRAYQVYTQNRERWKSIQMNGMQLDLSWDKPAEKWERLYSNVLNFEK